MWLEHLAAARLEGIFPLSVMTLLSPTDFTNFLKSYFKTYTLRFWSNPPLWNSDREGFNREVSRKAITKPCFWSRLLSDKLTQKVFHIIHTCFSEPLSLHIVTIIPQAQVQRIVTGHTNPLQFVFSDIIFIYYFYMIIKSTYIAQKIMKWLKKLSPEKIDIWPSIPLSRAVLCSCCLRRPIYSVRCAGEYTSNSSETRCIRFLSIWNY